MNVWLRTAYLCVLVSSAALAGSAGPQTKPTTAPAANKLTVLDVDGNTLHPLELGDSKAAVFLFIRTDCPISNSYSPEVQRICNAYAGQGVQFYFVHAEADLTPADVRKHADDFGLWKLPSKLVMDPKRALVHACGVRVTPEAAIVDPTGKVVYSGRIDDKWVGYGKGRPEPTVRDLRNALDAVLAGRPVQAAQGRAIGCPIE